MKSRAFTILATGLLTVPGTIGSHAATPQSGVIEQLERNSGGTLVIDFTPSLQKEFAPDEPEQEGAIDRATQPQQKVRDKASGPRRAKGFRVQIFADGRNQGTLQSRARARAKQVLGKFPEFRGQIYSISKSPNYFTRIGNFATRAEAENYLGKLRRAFPSFAGEMRVVPCEVILKN